MPNKRQFNLLLNVEQKLQQTLPLFTNNIAYELLSVHLQDVIAELSALTDTSVAEDAMDKIFKEFCVGEQALNTFSI